MRTVYRRMYAQMSLEYILLPSSVGDERRRAVGRSPSLMRNTTQRPLTYIAIAISLGRVPKEVISRRRQQEKIRPDVNHQTYGGEIGNPHKHGSYMHAFFVNLGGRLRDILDKIHLIFLLLHDFHPVMFFFWRSST